jgi:hypothetical protein
MIAAIPDDDQPRIIEQVVRLPGVVHRVNIGTITVEDLPAPPSRDQMVDIDALAQRLGIKRQPSKLTEFQDMLLQELERHAHMPTRFPPRRCLSCGAQTDADGDLPCDH